MPTTTLKSAGNPAFPAKTADADPSLVIADFLTNPHYGCGFPSARLGACPSIKTTRSPAASGYRLPIRRRLKPQACSTISPRPPTALSSGRAACSTSFLTAIRTSPGNGYTYTAPSAPLYNLTDDDFLPNTNSTAGSSATANDDPVLLITQAPGDALNSMSKSKCSTAITITTRPSSRLRTRPSSESACARRLQADAPVLRPERRRALGAAQLQRQPSETFTSSRSTSATSLLDPMDIVTLTDAYLGLNKQWVRITEITENDDGIARLSSPRNTCTVPATLPPIFPGGIRTSTPTTTRPPATPTFRSYSSRPRNWPKRWKSGLPPAAGRFWGGCDVYISNDGDSYKTAGRVSGSCRTGLLQSPLAAIAATATGQTIDTTNTLAVDLTQSTVNYSPPRRRTPRRSQRCAMWTANISPTRTHLDRRLRYDLTYLVRGEYGSLSQLSRRVAVRAHG